MDPQLLFVGYWWVTFLSFWQAVFYLSVLKPVVFLSRAYVIRAIVSSRIVVGGAALCLLCSNDVAAGLTR